MVPAPVRAAGKAVAAAEKPDDVRRFLAICSPLGIHTPFLFPEKSGADYETTKYLEPLQP